MTIPKAEKCTSSKWVTPPYWFIQFDGNGYKEPLTYLTKGFRRERRLIRNRGEAIAWASVLYPLGGYTLTSLDPEETPYRVNADEWRKHMSPPPPRPYQRQSP